MNNSVMYGACMVFAFVALGVWGAITLEHQEKTKATIGQEWITR